MASKERGGRGRREKIWEEKKRERYDTEISIRDGRELMRGNRYEEKERLRRGKEDKGRDITTEWKLKEGRL